MMADVTTTTATTVKKKEKRNDGSEVSARERMRNSRFTEEREMPTLWLVRHYVAAGERE